MFNYSPTFHFLRNGFLINHDFPLDFVPGGVLVERVVQLNVNETHGFFALLASLLDCIFCKTFSIFGMQEHQVPVASSSHRLTTLKTEEACMGNIGEC